jgi:O-antigen/teichoic acid export membrane protein
MAIAAIAVLATFYAIYLTGNEAIGLAGLGAFTMVGNLLRFTEKADGVITDTLYPALCAVQDKTQVLFEAFVKSNRLALMWAAPFGIGLSLFASDLIFHVLGDQWVGAIELLQIVGVITAVHHVGFNWSAFYRARGDTVPTAVSAVVGAVATIAAGVPLMFAFGITGLGWGYAVAELVGFFVRAIYIRRLFAGFNPIVHLLRALWPTAVGAAVVLAMRATGATVSGADGALLELAVFLGTIAVATWAFERRLLGEAIGYFSGRARPAATAESAPEPVG